MLGNSFVLRVGALALSFSCVGASFAGGAGVPADCVRNLNGSTIASLVKQYVPRNVSSSTPSAGVYLADNNGALIERLYEQNAHRTQAIASAQKIVTAYTAYLHGYKKGRVSLNTKVPFVESYMRWDLQGARARTDSGQIVTQEMARNKVKISFGKLIQNLLYLSSNGSGSAIADAVAGSQENFVRLMNQTTQSVLQKEGSAQSYFQNPHGLTDSSDEYRYADTNNRQQSNINNLARLTATMMADSGFRNFLGKSGMTGAPSGNLDKKGITQAAGTTVSRSIGLTGACKSYRVISVLFGRTYRSAESPNQADDFNNFHNKLTALLK